MEVKAKWRQFRVSIVRDLSAPYLIDESTRQVLIRRSLLRPFKMLAALIDAMNEVAERDVVWAMRVNRKGSLGDPTIELGGKKWLLKTCTVLGDPNPDKDTFNLRTVEIDWDRQELRVSSRFNLAFGAPALVDAVSTICSEALLEIVEDAEESIAIVRRQAESGRRSVPEPASASAA